MQYALESSIMAALLLAAAARAARPAGLLAFAGRWWQTWQIFKPRWLPDKPTGGCASCTSFWFVGFPVAVAVALTGGGWWAISVPFCVAVLSETLILA